MDSRLYKNPPVAKAVSDPSVTRVLRNTYMLLAFTMAWTAGAAGLSVSAGISPLAGLGLALAGLVALIATLFARNSGWGLVGVLVFTGLEGLSIGPTLNHYLNMAGGSVIIGQAAGITGVVFAALSAYVFVTKKDFSFMGGFLFAGLIAIILVSIGSLLFGFSGMHTAISAVSALLFCGYILYDTSRIVRGGEDNYILATVSLYLDIFNLFLNLLHLLGSGDD